MIDPGHTLRDNLRYYRAYLLLREAYPWMPIFFIYFSDALPLSQVLALESVYYVAIVVMEVPSGYLSDKLGRRPTLLMSSAALLISYLMFALGHGIWPWAIAQVFLALGLALASGTDTSLLYDTLEAQGEAEQYGELEASLGRLGAWSMAAGALLGGLIACAKPAWSYGLSALLAVGMCWCCWRLKEPPQQEQAPSLGAQLGQVFSYGRQPALLWLSGVIVVGVILNHIPYEFYSGYIALVMGQRHVPPGLYAPLVAGLHTTAAALLAGFAAGYSAKLAQRIGLRATLLMSLLSQLGLIALTSLWLHPLLAVALLARGVPGALARAPLRQAISPRLPQRLRATFFSVQSLAGRLGFAFTLLALAYINPIAGPISWPSLSAKLGLATAIGALLIVPLMLWRAKLSETSAENPT